MRLRHALAGTGIGLGICASMLGPAAGPASAAPPNCPPHTACQGPEGHPGPPAAWGRPDDDHWRGQDPPWGRGPAPWGFGAPPPPPPHGPLPQPWEAPPAPFDYYGQRVSPVWDPGFNQWGFWLFGIWIPL